MLAAYACDPKSSRGRLHIESESEHRSAFQRDRDRIIHSTAFRRLMHKTQVFVAHEGGLFRTRLTHTIEVGQVARTIASVLGLNIELTEAVALAHDLGHTP
ncbi:MAG: HD domain-containing protein, partial [Amylibacter sp.]